MFVNVTRNGKTFKQLRTVGAEKEVEKKEEEKPFDKKIGEIEKLTGIKLTKSKSSNSWYGEKNDVKIRISDHASKFTEKQDLLFQREGKDLSVKWSGEEISHIINGTDPFQSFSKGDKIKHVHESVGTVTFISSNHEKGFVEIENEKGEVKKYDMNKFLGAGNKSKSKKKLNVKDEIKNLDKVSQL